MSDLRLPLHAKISDDVIFQEISGEQILLNMSSEEYFGLDAVGTRVWGLLSAGNNPENIVSQLKTEYDVDEEVLRRDLAALFNDFKAANLIVTE